jgi:hypothetical protein
MALGTNQQTLTTGDKFIPELWGSEVRLALEANLIAANKIRRFNIPAKKGDTFHVPDVSNLVANTKTANAQVTLQSPTETEFTIAIDTHIESSFLTEDVLALQASYDLRQLYTQKAGYALAKKFDFDILALITGAGGQGSVGSAVTANASDITDTMIRDAMETLDVLDVPDDPRFVILFPSQKNALLGISKYVEAQMVGESKQRITGSLPAKSAGIDLYGMTFNFTTQIPTRVAGGGEVDTKRNFMAHKDGLACAVQQDTRTQSNYIAEYLGWLTTSDMVYGCKVYRANHIVQILTLV